MAPKQYSFQFGRVSIISKEIEDKFEFFDRVFSVNIPVSDKFNKYLFLDVQKIIHDGTTYYVGRLVKYKSINEEIVLENIHEFGSSTINDAVVVKPEFVLHPKTGVIAFRPIPSRFSAGQFRDKFARLIEKSYDNFFISTKVEAIKEDLKMQEVFNQFKTIFSIDVKLHPSNPNYNDIWHNLDDNIKALEATSYQIKASSGLKGLNKDKVKNDDLFSGIMMAADGYGSASIDGIKEDGRHVTISTTDNPTETKVPIDGNSEHLLLHLIKTFQLIWKRTKNDSKD